MSTLAGVLRPHISLDVSDIERSVEFYSALFGMSPIKQKSDYAKFELTEPALNFSINAKVNSGQSLERVGANLNHLGFQVATTEDVLDAKSRLEASGLIAFDEMDVSCCYAKQDKIWVHDPDGTPWEIFVVTEQNLDYRDDTTSKANCCVPTARTAQAAPSRIDLEVQKAPCC